MNRNDKQHFLSFCARAIERSYAQRFQDLWMLWESGFSRTGYFVEFGALNGRDFSNSYLLEQLGWNGVVAEPHPDYERLIRKNRRCAISTKCVLDKSGETVLFHAVEGRPALSTVEGFGNEDQKKELRSKYVSHPVETISLNDLLREAQSPRTIDFLSMDTEGSELVILNAFDFSDYQVNCVCVEHNARLRDDIFELLTSHGYSRKWEDISGHDDWYLLNGAYPGWSAAEMESMVEALASIPPFMIQLERRQEMLRLIASAAAGGAAVPASRARARS